VQPQKTAKVTRIKWSMVAAGIVLGLAAFFLFPDSLSLEGRGVVGIGVVMAFWWMTEAVPIEATSLLPLILFPVTGIAPIGEAAAPYANSVIYLVLGGIILGLATQRWNLHRRVALLIILAVGTKPSQIVFGLMLASAFITMWVSNTATAVIMVPIGGAILALINSLEGSKVTPKLAASMLLGIAYSVTIGSMATLIGQPPMALMKAYLGDNYNVEIGFGQWMLVGVPLAAFMMTASWVVLTKFVFRSEVEEIPGGREIMRTELAKLGGLTTQEKRVIAIFLGAAFCWIFMPFNAEMPAVAAVAPFLANFNDTSIAITAAVLCFIVPGDKVSNGPLLEWSATKEVPWGLLILFGGGLSLSDQFTSTGLERVDRRQRGRAGRRADPAADGHRDRPAGHPDRAHQQHRDGAADPKDPNDGGGWLRNAALSSSGRCRDPFRALVCPAPMCATTAGRPGRSWCTTLAGHKDPSGAVWLSLQFQYVRCKGRLVPGGQGRPCLADGASSTSGQFQVLLNIKGTAGGNL
jgi:solute carrier family 13 (sodium-dependent dicarboxylate transporter), member 2/3/5